MVEGAAVGRGRSKEDADRTPAEKLLELRGILFGSEQKRLGSLEERLDNTEVRAREIGSVLPEIVSRGVEQNPIRVSEALLVVIAPAIRGAVSAAFREMIANLDRVLEHSLSPTAWRWRFQAWRTGKPFAEIVLLKTLAYRVEQVFLVHRETSLLLGHAQAEKAGSKDPHQVSAMLAAIQDFVQQSFDGASSGANASTRHPLGSIQVGDLTIWIEQGPLAFLAVAIRGTAPLEYRAQIRSVLDRIHLGYYNELSRFPQTPSELGPCTPLLESCLQFQLKEQFRGKRPVYGWVFCGLLALALAAGLGILVRDLWRWYGYLDALRQQPGITVTAASAGVRSFWIAGLRDPMAADPARLLSVASLSPERVRASWNPYISAAPEIVVMRARQRLNPPEGVELSAEGGTLRASGVAPAHWIGEAVRMAGWIPGVEAFDSSGLLRAEWERARRQKETVEAGTVLFDKGSSYFNALQAESAGNAAAAVEELVRLAEAAGAMVSIRIVGHADRDGESGENVALSERRARRFQALLLSKGLPPGLFELHGAGTSQPVREERAEEDKALNRRVTLEVELREIRDGQDR